MAYYRRCIQRHLFVFGQDRRYLCKDPNFCGRVQALSETFPDAKFVYLVRNPCAVVPSLLSLLSEHYSVNGHVDAILHEIGHRYRYPLAQLDKRPVHQTAIVPYSKISKNPDRTVRELYRQFGLKLAPAYEPVLAKAKERADRYSSAHDYSLEQFGLSDFTIQVWYSDILNRFGFERASQLPACDRQSTQDEEIQQKVAIVGGGIGGLVAAAAMRRVGITAAVFERASSVLEAPHGLLLWPSAIKALQVLGLNDEVVEQGSTIEEIVTLDWRGRVLASMPLVALQGHAGAPAVGICQQSLRQLLFTTVEETNLHFGAEYVGFVTSANGVTLRLSDGRNFQAQALVGADGIHSTVRAELLGKTEPRYAGYYACRGFADLDTTDLPAHVVTFIVGQGTLIRLVPFGRGRISWFATVLAEKDDLPPHELGSFVQERLQGCPSQAADVIRATDAAAMVATKIVDRPPAPRWGVGRATLLGDAIHPMPPFVAQGACQAIEDAVILADCMAANGDSVEAQLRAYEHARQQRTADISNASRTLGNVLHWQNPLAVWLRNGLIRIRTKTQSDAWRGIEELTAFETPPVRQAVDGPVDETTATE